MPLTNLPLTGIWRGIVLGTLYTSESERKEALYSDKAGFHALSYEISCLERIQHTERGPVFVCFRRPYVVSITLELLEHLFLFFGT